MDGQDVWAQAGISSERETQEWEARGFTPSAASQWRHFFPIPARGDEPDYFAARAAPWRDAGFEPAEARAWLSNRIGPESAARWRDADVSPREAARREDAARRLRWAKQQLANAEAQAKECIRTAERRVVDERLRARQDVQAVAERVQAAEALLDRVAAGNTPVAELTQGADLNRCHPSIERSNT